MQVLLHINVFFGRDTNESRKPTHKLYPPLLKWPLMNLGRQWSAQCAVLHAFTLVVQQSAQDSNFLFSTAGTPIWIHISRLLIESPQRLVIEDVILLDLYALSQ